MALTISLNRRMHEFDDAPVVASVATLGQFRNIIGNFLGANPGPLTQLHLTTLGLQISPLIPSLQQSQILGEHIVHLERCVQGEMVPRETLEGVYQLAGAIHGFHMHAQTVPLGQSVGFVRTIDPRPSMRRVTMPPEGLTMPPSLRLERPDAPITYPKQGENREITVVFVDIVGFTPLGEMLSHDEVFPVLNEILEEIEEAVESEGGEVPGNWGDAGITLFGSRRGENHARAAIRACLKAERAIVEWNKNARRNGMPELRTRFGVNTGESAVGYLGGKRRKVRTAIGRNVNIAARLEPLAFFEREGGVKEFGILVSAQTLRRAGSFFVTEPAGVRSLKGVTEAIETHRVLHEAPPSLVPRGAFQTTFIGRQQEFTQLQNGYRDCCENNNSRCFVVKGDAGEGKSRLGDRFIRALGQDVTILIAQGEDREALIPYEAIATALSAFAGIEPGEAPERAREKVKYVTQTASASDQDVAKDLERRMPYLWQLLNIPYKNDSSAQIQEELVERPKEFWEQVLRTVEILLDQLSNKGPLVLVVEDLHWVDAGSLGFLKRLLKTFHDRRFFVIGLSRPHFLDEAADFLQEIKGDVIPLTHLSEDQLRKIVLEVLPTPDAKAAQDEYRKMVDRLILLSGHNPYLITEMASAVRNGMVIEQDHESKSWQFISNKHGVSKVVPLPSGAMGFLQAKIDLLGEVHKEALRLAAVIGGEVSRDDLVGLVRELTVTTEGKSLLSPETERRLLEEPNAVLKEMGTEKIIIVSEEVSGRFQFPHALLRETAYEQIWRNTRAEIHLAMVRYLKSNRPTELATIASHLASGGHKDEASQYYYNASERGSQADPEGSIEYYRKGYEQASEPRLKLRLLRGWDEALYMSGRYQEQERIYQLSLPLLEMLPLIDHAGTHYRRSRALNKLFKFDEAIPELQTALRIIADISPQSSLEKTEMLKLKASALLQIGLTYGEIGRAEDALRVYQEGYEAASEAGDYLNVGRGLWGLVDGANKVGKYSGILQRCQLAYESLVKINDRRRCVGLMAECSRAYLQLGDYSSAEVTLKRAQEIAKELRGLASTVGEIPPLMGRALTLAGRSSEAILLLSSLQIPDKYNNLFRLVYLAFAYLDDNQLQAAREESEKAIELATETKNPSMLAVARMLVAQVLMREGKLSQALSSNLLALDIFNEGKVTADLDAEILLTQAVILDKLGKSEDAWEYIERAKQILVQRSKTIDDEKTRASFLGGIKVNRDIIKLWQVLDVSRHSEPGRRAEIRGYLEQLEFYHSSAVPGALRDLIDQTLNTPNEIISTVDHEITHEHGSHEPAEVGALVIDGTLASVFDFVSKSEIELDVNPGDIEEFRAEDISFRLLRDHMKALRGLADWEIGSPLIRGKIAVALSRRGKMREILDGEVASHNGSVVIELKRSKESSFISQDGEVFDFKKRKRPKGHEFGTLRFTFVPRDIDKAVVVMEMGKALYSRNVRNFLAAFRGAYNSRRK